MFAYEVKFQTRVESDIELTRDEIYDRAVENVTMIECSFDYDEEDTNA